jgi:uncharacterized membrane protein
VFNAYALSYVATAVAFLIVDSIWLGVMGGLVYRPLLGDMLLAKFNVVAAVAFYLLYVVGLVVFAVAPALGAGRWQVALIHGALFGFFAYATYDLTNLATLKNWSTLLSLIDMGWGTLASAAAATAGFLAVQAILGTTAVG